MSVRWLFCCSLRIVKQIILNWFTIKFIEQLDATFLDDFDKVFVIDGRLELLSISYRFGSFPILNSFEPQRLLYLSNIFLRLVFDAALLNRNRWLIHKM
jgi:hypothetical protein